MMGQWGSGGKIPIVLIGVLLLAYLEFEFQIRYRHCAPSVYPSPISTSPAKPLRPSG